MNQCWKLRVDKEELIEELKWDKENFNIEIMKLKSQYEDLVKSL